MSYTLGHSCRTFSSLLVQMTAHADGTLLPFYCHICHHLVYIWQTLCQVVCLWESAGVPPHLITHCEFHRQGHASCQGRFPHSGSTSARWRRFEGYGQRSEPTSAIWRLGAAALTETKQLQAASISFDWGQTVVAVESYRAPQSHLELWRHLEIMEPVNTKHTGLRQLIFTTNILFSSLQSSLNRQSRFQIISDTNDLVWSLRTKPEQWCFGFQSIQCDDHLEPKYQKEGHLESLAGHRDEVDFYESCVLPQKHF